MNKQYYNRVVYIFHHCICLTNAHLVAFEPEYLKVPHKSRYMKPFAKYTNNIRMPEW